jgi:uroporphyrinogen-III synthase
MDYETIQALISQGVAVAIVVAIGAGIAHYWLRHGLPHKIAKDETDRKLAEQTGDAIERLATSHEESVVIFRSMGGDVKQLDNRLENVETELQEVKRRTGEWKPDGNGGLKKSE